MEVKIIFFLRLGFLFVFSLREIKKKVSFWLKTFKLKTLKNPFSLFKIYFPIMPFWGI